ncbi:MAG: C4-dicarboxylate TRAP transporter small permease protein DctQ [Calditrichia bacterium]
MKKLISAIDNGLALIENVLLITLLAVMVLMAFFQVILRNVFSEGILWGDIFLRHLVLWVGFVGASLATRESKHINIDVLSRLASKGKLPFVRMIIDLISAAVCFVLARAGYKFLMYEIEARTTLFKNVPAWLFQLIIPVGFALIGFRFLLKIPETFYSSRQPKGETPSLSRAESTQK